MQTFDKNDLVIAQRNFVVNGAPVDPATVRVKYRTPLGSTSNWFVAGVDEQVETPQPGSYAIRINLDSAGMWSVRWESTGAYQSAIEGSFYVRPTNF